MDVIEGIIAQPCVAVCIIWYHNTASSIDLGRELSGPLPGLNRRSVSKSYLRSSSSINETYSCLINACLPHSSLDVVEFVTSQPIVRRGRGRENGMRLVM